MKRYTNFIWALSGEPQEMLVQDGNLVARYAAASSSAAFGETVDLGGRFLLPSFVDAHCHILPTGLDLQKLHLGAAGTPEEALDLVSSRHQEQPDGWLHAVHYDQHRIGRHLTRDELDSISSTRPILLRHVNGHASVANSAALNAAGVHESTPNPVGGEYVRDESNRLTGLLLELAHEHVTGSAPCPTLNEMVDAILRAGKAMRKLGIGSASDMMTGFFDLKTELAAYQAAIDQGCEISIRLFLQWKSVFGPRGIGVDALSGFGPTDRLRIAGIKIFADGAISSATAAIYGRYSGQPANGPKIARRAPLVDSVGAHEVDGQLIYRPERLFEMVHTAHNAGFPIAIHAIGDYAIDLVTEAFADTDEPSRHRLEHASLITPRQIDRIAKLGFALTFQPEFMPRFGSDYVAQLGSERIKGMKPTKSILHAGIPLCFSSDRPIVGGNPWDGILAAENRLAPFDPSENISRRQGINLYTVAASQVNGDNERFGSLLAGSHADFQLYEEDPLTASNPTPVEVITN